MFDSKAQEYLGYYVYALFDSANPKIPFYIGKGRGNRVFAHASGADIDLNEDEVLSPKLQLIAEIKKAGRKVEQQIIKFGLSEDEAFKVEASLIDLVNYMMPDTLKNQISGQGVAEGIYDADELATSLGAQQLQSELPLLVIKIERKWGEFIQKYGSSSAIPPEEIYDATKGNWRLSTSRASRAVCVLSVARGLVRAVFVPTGWADAGYENRKVMKDVQSAEAYREFVGTSVAHLFQRGSQNPVRYLRC